MTDFIPGIGPNEFFAEVMSLEKRGDETIATVRTMGPKVAPVFLQQLRARARALIAAGAVNSAINSVSDVAMGDVDRLTDVRSRTRLPEMKSNRGPDLFMGFEWEIAVNND